MPKSTRRINTFDMGSRRRHGTGHGVDSSDPMLKALERLRHVYLAALRDAVRDPDAGHMG